MRRIAVAMAELNSLFLSCLISMVPLGLGPYTTLCGQILIRLVGPRLHMRVPCTNCAPELGDPIQWASAIPWLLGDFR